MANVTGVNSKYCCIKVQQMLDDILGADNPANKERDTFGFLNALSSGRNKNGFAPIQTESSRGKALPETGNREVEIKYRPRQCVTTTETALDLCDAGAASTDNSEYFRVSVDQVVATAGVQLSKSDFRDLCESPDERRALEFADHVIALKRAVNDALLTSAIAVVGDYFSEDGAASVDSAASPITLYPFTATAQPNAMGLYPVVRQYRRMGTAAPIVIAGNTVDMWNYATPVFRGDNDGKDITRIGSLDAYVDYNLDSTWNDGDEHMLSFVPGYMQMTEWFRYVGDYEERDDNWTATVLDVDGFRFDFSVYYDECNQRWQLHFSKHFDLWNIPQEAFSSACGQLHNGILNWIVDCGDLTCDIKDGAVPAGS